MKTTPLILFCSVLAAPLWGQAVLPGRAATPFGAPQNAQAGAPTSNVVQNTNATTSGDYTSTTSENMADRLFDVNSDSVDLENGSLQWKGRTFNLGNSRMMRARLERYLAAPVPEGDNRRYEEMLTRIEDLLSPAKINRDNYNTRLQEAWNLLFETAQFDADAENCLTIATLVEKTAKMRNEMIDLQVSRNQNTVLRNHQAGGVTSRARLIEEAADEASRKANLGSKPKPYRAPTQGSNDLTRRQKELAETEATSVKIDGEMSLIGLKSQVEFQSQIVAFLLQRRFHHAIIAGSFYRQLFRGSAQHLRVGNQQVKEMFPVSDMVPTIDSVDMLAREAIKDVDTGMKAVQQLYDVGDRYAAFERMQETFFLGEYEPSVMFFDPEKKRTLQDIWRNLRDLQRMGDERDLSGVEDAVNKVKAVAQDFPSVQVMSRVNNAMQASNLAVLSAKQAALMGDNGKAEAQIERAAKIWPTNPAIKDFAQQVLNQADILAQKVPEFDRLLQGGRYREIYNRKEEFAVALLQDKERAEKLKNVLRDVGQIDGYLLNAKALSSQGNGYMAWDVLQEATRFGASDPELAKARSEMAPEVANYASLLANAERSEKSGNYAASLAAYLAAQDLNQGSEFCRQGIKRLSALLLDQTVVRPTATTAMQ